MTRRARPASLMTLGAPLLSCSQGLTSRLSQGCQDCVLRKLQFAGSGVSHQDENVAFLTSPAPSPWSKDSAITGGEEKQDRALGLEDGEKLC